MDSIYSVKLSRLVEEYGLEILHKASDYDTCEVSSTDVSRPGLPLIGFTKHFDNTRLQIVGKVEHTYLEEMSDQERREQLDKYMSLKFPALIISRGMDPLSETLEMARKHDHTVLRTPEITTAFLGQLIIGLRNHMAPRITRHGVLVEIYGEGVLIFGESGVGKSETAIELIKRGHRLIADDAVEIRRTSENQLMGSAPELIRHYMELRGIGVVDVRRLFGIASIKSSTEVELLINLEPWRDGAVYDRLGLEENFTNILDIDVPTVTIPVSPGRNLAVIIEVAAMNNRYKRLGFNAAQAFVEQVNKNLEQALGQ